ncbi:hypothetical protein, partial [Gardnerella sp. KA00735]|uniref:hypothetical protein n=1 Tax=Gardnerella sp. KA00735 TaxID=1973156 RepID=UPI000CB8DA25
RLDKSLRSSSDKSKGLMPTVSLRKSDNKNAYNAKFEDEGEEELVKPLIANHEPENIVDDIRPVATFAN